MGVKIPDNLNKVKTLCHKYQKQLRELTQKCDKEHLEHGMEEYYLSQKILDFEALCNKNNIDFTIVNERDTKRRGGKLPCSGH